MVQKAQNNDTPEIVASPEGHELRGNISFGRLGQRPGGPDAAAGVLAMRSGQPVLCGHIIGTAYAFATGTGQYGEFTRIIGEFLALPWNREPEIQGTEIFLPPVAERFILAGLKTGGPVSFAFEGWCYPDATAPRGYTYRTFVRQPAGSISTAKRLAIAAGILEAPEGVNVLAIEEQPYHAARLPAPAREGSGDPDYDSVTGEVVPVGDGGGDDGEAKLKDGLDAILRPAAAAE